MKELRAVTDHKELFALLSHMFASNDVDRIARKMAVNAQREALRLVLPLILSGAGDK